MQLFHSGKMTETGKLYFRNALLFLRMENLEYISCMLVNTKNVLCMKAQVKNHQFKQLHQGYFLHFLVFL